MNTKIIFRYLLTVLFLWSALTTGSFASLMQGDEIPEGELISVEGLNYNLRDYSGKTLTVIWVTSLNPTAMNGTDNFLEIYGKYSADEVSFFIVSTINKNDTLNYIQEHRIPCPVLLGGADSFTKKLTGESGYGIDPVNNFFIFNKDGKLSRRIHLPGLPTRHIEALINQVLNQSNSN